MRLLLQACSQTDTDVSLVPTCGRCRPIKYWGCASGKCLLLLRRIDRCLKKLVRREKYQVLFKFRSYQSYRVHVSFCQRIKSSFTNWRVVYLFIKAHCTIYDNTCEKREARSRLQTWIKQINNSASCNIHNSSKCWQTHLSRNMSHRDCGSTLRFLQIKSSTRNDSRVHERQYIFFIPESVRAFRWQPPAGARRSFVFVYRLDCCSRDKMPAREKSMKWSFAHTHHDSSFNSRIKLNDRDAESKNHKRDREFIHSKVLYFSKRDHVIIKENVI